MNIFIFIFNRINCHQICKSILNVYFYSYSICSSTSVNDARWRMCRWGRNITLGNQPLPQENDGAQHEATYQHAHPYADHYGNQSTCKPEVVSLVERKCSCAEIVIILHINIKSMTIIIHIIIKIVIIIIFTVSVVINVIKIINIVINIVIDNVINTINVIGIITSSSASLQSESWNLSWNSLLHAWLTTAFWICGLIWHGRHGYGPLGIWQHKLQVLVFINHFYPFDWKIIYLNKAIVNK